MYCYWICILFLFSHPTKGSSNFSGAPDNRGTEYIVGFMKNRNSVFDLEIFVTTSITKTVNVRVRCPNWGTLDSNFTVTSGYVHLFTIDSTYRIDDATIEPKGILITADDEITIYGVNKQVYSTDAFLGIPTDVLGKNYYAVTYFPSNWETQVMIIGVFDTTVVEIRFPSGSDTGIVSFNGTNYNPGDRMSILLNRYDSLQLQGRSDLTGAHITSDKAISVFSGNALTKIGSGGSVDHLVEQLTPVNTWGKVFATAPIPARTTGDYFRFIASENNTKVSYTCNKNGDYSVTNFTLSVTGNFKQELIASSKYCCVRADKPILLVQFVLSMQNSAEPSDPSMIIVPPTEQYAADYTFTTPKFSGGSYENVLMFIVKNSERNGLRIDDNPMPTTTSYNNIPGTDYVGGYVNISEGSHTIKHISPISVFGVFLYGRANAESYGFPAGMRLAGINEPCVKTVTVFGDGIDNDCDGRIDEELCTGENSGKDDDGDGVADEDCAQPAPINGGWTEWTQWGDCIEACPLPGSTIEQRKSRTRTCSNPSPQYSGQDCVGNSTDSVECTVNIAGTTRKNLNKWRSSSRFINVNFTSSVAWIKEAPNIAVCSFKCEKDESCLSFVYNNGGGICQGHSKMYLNPTAITSQVQDNTKYFIVNDDYIIEQATAILYKIYPTCMKYTAAKAVCQADKAQLVIIDTTDKLYTIWTAIEQTGNYVPGSSLYVSGYLTNTNVWKYWNNQTIPDTVWTTGNATSASNRCVTVTKQGLVSSHCDVIRHFICER